MSCDEYDQLKGQNLVMHKFATTGIFEGKKGFCDSWHNARHALWFILIFSYKKLGSKVNLPYKLLRSTSFLVPDLFDDTGARDLPAAESAAWELAGWPKDLDRLLYAESGCWLEGWCIFDEDVNSSLLSFSVWMPSKLESFMENIQKVGGHVVGPPKKNDKIKWETF